MKLDKINFLKMQFFWVAINELKLDLNAPLKIFGYLLPFFFNIGYVFRNHALTRRSSDVESLDALTSIQYKSVQGSRKQATGESGKVYRDLQNRYRFNVTYTYVIISHLESGMKYRLVLKALNRDTNSLPVTKQTFTGNAFFTDLFRCSYAVAAAGLLLPCR